MDTTARPHEDGPDRQGDPIVLRGLRAVDRWTAVRRGPAALARAEALSRLSSFAFSGIVHLLALLLLIEVVWLAAPRAQEKVLTARLRRPGREMHPGRPAPEPSASEAEAPTALLAPAPIAPPPAPTPQPAVEAFEGPPGPAALGVVEGIAAYPAGDLGGAGDGFAGDRSAAGRRTAVERYGGNLASESAVELGLDWLAAHQEEDGRWCPSGYLERCPEPGFCGGGRRGPTAYAEGTTALALLAFLGAGCTHREGRHQEAVARGLAWLLGRQHATGFFFDPSEQTVRSRGMYGHGIATFALGEAALLTQDPVVLAALDRAVAALATAQQANGGWFYLPDPSVRQTEFTISVWQMMGLKAADRAGARVPADVVAAARRHVLDNHAPDGSFRYVPGGRATEGATGAGLFARCMFGLADGPRLEQGWAWLERRTKTAPDPARVGTWQYLYSWYYRTLVAHQLQGRAWRDWNGRIRPFLVSTQRTRGHAAGSWPFIDYEQGSTIYATALCVLMLETYYRYAPAAVDPAAAVVSLVGRAAPATVEEERRMDALRPPTPDVLEARRRRDRDEARRRLSSEAPEERYLGARRLSELGDREALPSMLAAAKREVGRLRAAHLLFLGRLKDEGAVDFLVQELDDADSDVRAAAASALSAITGVYLAEASRWKEWHRGRKAGR